MSNEKRFVCTECSYVVHPATYCSQCPQCAGDLRPARQELHADRKLPTYRAADAD